MYGEHTHIHKTPSFDTEMILKVVFDERAFVRFKISNNFFQTLMKQIQNIQKSTGKSISLWILKISRKIFANQSL
jgi:hypothetical protein